MDLQRRPLPGQVLSEQLKDIFSKNHRVVFLPKELYLTDVLKKDDDTYEISHKGNRTSTRRMKRQLESWDIEENDGKGDCMFNAMSQILNGGASDSTFKGSRNTN